MDQPGGSADQRQGDADVVGDDRISISRIRVRRGRPLPIPVSNNDVDALLKLQPDCVVYNPMWIHVDELMQILSAGVNVVATASFITGHSQGEGRDRIAEACERGGSTMFGSGISPGYINLLAILAASICDRVDEVTIEKLPTPRSTTRPPPRTPDYEATTLEEFMVLGRIMTAMPAITPFQPSWQPDPRSSPTTTPPRGVVAGS